MNRLLSFFSPSVRLSVQHFGPECHHLVIHSVITHLTYPHFFSVSDSPCIHAYLSHSHFHLVISPHSHSPALHLQSASLLRPAACTSHQTVLQDPLFHDFPAALYSPAGFQPVLPSDYVSAHSLWTAWLICALCHRIRWLKYTTTTNWKCRVGLYAFLCEDSCLFLMKLLFDHHYCCCCHHHKITYLCDKLVPEESDVYPES